MDRQIDRQTQTDRQRGICIMTEKNRDRRIDIRYMMKRERERERERKGERERERTTTKTTTTMKNIKLFGGKIKVNRKKN